MKVVRADLSAAERARLVRDADAALRESTVTMSTGAVFTKPSPKLYPHRWGWDTPDAARAHKDQPLRGLQEIEGQLNDQWADGRVPQITYNPDVPDGVYFPHPSTWNCRAISPLAPRHVESAALIQPPTQARAVLELLDAAEGQGGETAVQARATAQRMLPRLLAWHGYLHDKRDPERTGIPTIVSPWESGLDNPPLWEPALDNIRVPDDLPAFERTDIKHADPSMRPTQLFYERMVTLIEAYKAVGFDDLALDDYPFKVKDPHMGALLLDANRALEALGRRLGMAASDLDRIGEWAERGRAGLAAHWDDALGGVVPVDMLTGDKLTTRTVTLFAPLMAGEVTPKQFREQMDLLLSEHFVGNAGNVLGLPQSTGFHEGGFDPDRYWCGPKWGIMSFRILEGLERVAARDDMPAAQRVEAAQVADAFALNLAACYADKGLYEYFNPLTGAPLGSFNQSWSCMIAKELAQRPAGAASTKLQAQLPPASAPWLAVRGGG